MADPTLARITLFPIKSLDGVTVDRARLTPAGALAGDREFALFDAAGQVINAKRNAAIQRIRSTFDLAQRTVSLSIQNTSPQNTTQNASAAPATFGLDGDRSALAAWFSDYFGQPVTIAQNPASGFPDDRAAWGPTVISTGTLTQVARWFAGISIGELRDRLRTNLEIDGVEPFWEERLYDQRDRPVAFQIGSVAFLGINPCQRCIVPTRDARTGDPTPNFQKMFIAQRQKTLPPWAERSRFNHFYRLAVNTQVPPIDPAAADRLLAVGDRLILANC